MKHIGTVDIRTERMLLRPFRNEDAESFYRNYSSDEKVHKYFNYISCRTMAETESMIDEFVYNYKEDKFYKWAMTLDDEVFGFIGLRNISDADRSAELRFTFGSKWWWNGYSTEATKAVIDFAFNTLGLHRIYATHHVKNVSNGSTYVKAGMELEGTLWDGYRNDDGTYSDMKQYAIINR